MEQDVSDPGKLKERVQGFWSAGSCGEVYRSGSDLREQLQVQARTRYALEPYLPAFARFRDGAGRDVLEVGVGMGADHLEWARSEPRRLIGVDLTRRALDHTRQRFALEGCGCMVVCADAERLPFADESFDIVYSWGVLHHTPDTPQAVNEVWRVLRPGGEARIMIYHTVSVVGLMLWMRYALLAGRPWRSLRDIYANHLESPGTKAYSVAEAQAMCAKFSRAVVGSQLSFGDLLLGSVGQRHRGLVLSTARKFWPRWLIRRVAGRAGLYIVIDAVK